MAKQGRPFTYNPAVHVPLALELFSAGKVMAEVAKEMGIGVGTLYEWQKTYPDLAEAIKRGRDVIDSQVEASLYKRATGYSHPDVHISNFQGDVTITPIVKHYAPDATSMIFWLKNRKPKEWRDKIDADLKLEAGDGLIALIAKIRSGNAS